MEEYVIIIVCLIASIGAGVATGFAGLSAAVFISPMLVTFLHVPTYEAIGIALASDVLASLFSAVNYGIKRNIEFKKGLPLLITVIIFCVVGSIAGYFITRTNDGNTSLGYWTILASTSIGVQFIVNPSGNKSRQSKRKTHPLVLTILFGMFIGFICGFQGTGGGMWMLFALSIVLAFEFKKAVGTSVFIMTFTALIGSVSHFLIYGTPNFQILALCVVFTLLAAIISSYFANRMDSTNAKRTTGFIIFISSIMMVIVNLRSGEISETYTTLLLLACMTILAMHPLYEKFRFQEMIKSDAFIFNYQTIELNK